MLFCLLNQLERIPGKCRKDDGRLAYASKQKTLYRLGAHVPGIHQASL
jgi:hypothetical protein